MTLMKLTLNQLTTLDLPPTQAQQLIDQVNPFIKSAATAEEAWHLITKHNVIQHYSFNIQLFFFNLCFPNWQDHPETAAAWLPEKEYLSQTHLFQFMTELDISDVKQFHTWTTKSYEKFWAYMLTKLNIVFKKNPEKICDLTEGIESPLWLKGASLNIVDSCFTAPSDAIALIYPDRESFSTLSYDELNALSNRIANSLIKQGIKSGEKIAIAMPMNQYAIAIYLGIIKMGGIVVSIADSFSSQEMETRMAITHTKIIFTQDVMFWCGKKHPLYEKVKNTSATQVIVLSCEQSLQVPLRETDLAWQDFLVDETNYQSLPCTPMQACNILFSSGTTSEPKAIVWNHTTAIKAASDAFLHQDINPYDRLAWPTNLGWMMGPWLIFAALINQACIVLYPEAPKDRHFGEFIQETKVTMLGVVPTLVASWRQTHCMEKLDWRCIKLFSSTGECSNAEDMLYLMSLAGYKPIIEYCGGTEIGGAYLTSTLIQKNYPSLFSTPAMGIDISILDERGLETNEGEVAIIPPSMGLSTQLLNADHHQIYYANMPKTKEGFILRRHGDQIKKLKNGYFCILGRVDDTMNLGGIKISAAEIERALVGISDIKECAAIAISPSGNGPSQLVIYAATDTKLEKNEIRKIMQQRINTHLNPLFKIHDVVFVAELPKTASNKIMRRLLRKQYGRSTWQ